MEIMKRLHKHKLHFDPTWKFVQDNLDNVNALSVELLNLLNFKNGHFFTLLPDDAHFERIYKFKEGGILPQFPKEESIVTGHRSTYSRIPNIDKELSQLILKEITSHKHLSCIFDDVSFSPVKLKGYSLFDNYGLSYENESYYLLKKNKVSSEFIAECLKVSNAFWHSLCVFTITDFNEKIKTLSLEEIKEICLTTKLIMIGAYDAEGYVFWEKNLTNENKFFE